MITRSGLFWAASLVAVAAAVATWFIVRGERAPVSPPANAGALDPEAPLDATSMRPTMRRIEAGTFTMGSPADEPGRGDDEAARSVRVTDAFLLGETEVTQAQWAATMGTMPSYFRDARGGGPDHPVERVSWYDAVAYLNRISQNEGFAACYVLDECEGEIGTGCNPDDEVACSKGYRCKVAQLRPGCDGYRLPTEAEWEYAARAGTTTTTYAGPLEVRGMHDAPELDAIAWYGGNSRVDRGGYDCRSLPEKHFEAERCGTHPVGGKRPNAWGLYDVIGNVWEWTNDGQIVGRIARGGGWNATATGCRVALRTPVNPRWRYGNQGIRPARDAD